MNNYILLVLQPEGIINYVKVMNNSSYAAAEKYYLENKINNLEEELEDAWERNEKKEKLKRKKRI